MSTQVARDGDVLVVTYGEVKLPFSSTKFGSISVGNVIYTRKLVAGDDVEVEYDRTYAFLKRLAERDAKEKLRVWSAELASARRMAETSNRENLPPKPEPVRR